ncbi:Six-hairpin glycosidase [Russula earlei]|uniref:Six-hairpin glycosidase n=1 Tax=Russula earlei TaxID=71964 RepID=A0ACC0UIX5_9AGAM|nr:Six-hairpin glycosidase [Russula earlei]
MIWYRLYTVIALYLGLVSSALVPRAFPGLNTTILRRVRNNAVNISTHSWEIGTLAEALTEAEWPALSPFMPGLIFPPTRLPWWENAYDVLAIAEMIIDQKANGTLTLTDGQGAVGDPASLGQAVLLRNWTRVDLTDTRFSTAAGEQLGYLLSQAPRAASGAISHRESEVQLWSDFVYMAPPFIAYFGALQNDVGGHALLQIAYDQIRLYRDALFDADASLWRHITLGSWEDTGHWATGNAWAAAGMMRVLTIIRRSNFASQMESQQDNLAQWVNEILTGMWRYQQDNGTLLNYVDQPDSFADSSSTALLAATTLRYSLFTDDGKHDIAAFQALELVFRSIDEDGWLHNTVNPLWFSERSPDGSHSPEGQSFVLLLAAAWAAF